MGKLLTKTVDFFDTTGKLIGGFLALCSLIFGVAIYSQTRINEDTARKIVIQEIESDNVRVKIRGIVREETKNLITKDTARVIIKEELRDVKDDLKIIKEHLIKRPR